MNGKTATRVLRANINSVLVIHYSCQNLNDNNEGYSPRITSIAVLHVRSSTMHSFSIHLVAERRRIAREDIGSHYDDLESEMLRDFYGFVKDHQDHYWLHWNMSNINYGFEALEHRFRVLTEEVPPKVDDSKKYNLSTLIAGVYGSNYVDHPKLMNLMEVNGGKHRDFLTGKEEVEAFERQEYIKLHKSTMSKVYFFQKMFFAVAENRVRTQHSNWPARINRMAESPWAKALGLVAVIFTLYQGVVAGWMRLAPSGVAEARQTEGVRESLPTGEVSAEPNDSVEPTRGSR